jgi:hypothetical protein
MPMGVIGLIIAAIFAAAMSRFRRIKRAGDGDDD